MWIDVKKRLGYFSKLVVIVVVVTGLVMYMVPVTLYLDPRQSASMAAGYMSGVQDWQETGHLGYRDSPRNGTSGNPNYLKTGSMATQIAENGGRKSVAVLKWTRERPVPENLLNVGPFQFLSTFKNPCWNDRGRESAISCFPYFYLAGFPKAGTTDAFRRLTRHPEISRMVTKEPHWLTRRRYLSQGDGQFSRYLQVFNKATMDILQTEVSGDYHHKIMGDCSASTLWDNNHWQIFPENEGLSEPRYTTADYLHHINPKTKFIVMIRDPTERLYSDYLFFGHVSKDLRDFHDSANRTIQDINACLQTHSLRYCAYRKSIPGYHVRLALGLYHVYIEDYLRLFPRQQMLMVKMENYAKNLSKYVEQMFEFLELSPVDVETMAVVGDDTKKANSRSKANKALGDMLPETRKLLQEFYRPYNEKLATLLGEDFNYNSHVNEYR